MLVIQEIPSGQAPQLNYRSVVSNFIIQNKDSNSPKVALFRRSHEVRTYQGMLAPISGSVDSHDRSPLEAAVRELQEETGLVANKDLELHLRGKPFTISDAAIGTSWTIYPFSWILKNPQKSFKIDWEHSDWQWMSSRDILSGKHEKDSVPHLSDSLWRVWLGEGGMFDSTELELDCKSPGRLLQESLLALKNDHESGARYMASNALQYLHDVISATQKEIPPKQLWLLIRMTAWHLINNGRASMNAAISKALLLCLRSLRSQIGDRQALLNQIRTCIAERKVSSKKIAESFATYIQHHFRDRFSENPDKPAHISVLTLSSSITKSALLAALRSCNVSLDVRILESRPLCEGAQMASNLLVGHHADIKNRGGDASRLRITIATDASAAILARDVDMVLLGADRISEAGDVSNKTGSLSAVLCARAVGKKSPTHATDTGHAKIGHYSSGPLSSSPSSPQIVILSGIEKISKPGATNTASHRNEEEEEDNSALQIWRIWELAGCKLDTGAFHLGRLAAQQQLCYGSSNNTHDDDDNNNKNNNINNLSSPPRVIFKNVFFEWVPAEYIDTYLTEDGELTREMIAERSREVGWLDDEIFGDC